MGLDIRLPIGLMFCLMGPLLLGTGLAEGSPLSARTGGAMLLFGGVMLALGLRAQLSASSSEASSSSDASASSSSSSSSNEIT